MATSSSQPTAVTVLGPPHTAELLGRIIEAARAGAPDAIVAFDLDSTLLDNRPRQAQILREYGEAHALAALAGHEAAGDPEAGRIPVDEGMRRVAILVRRRRDVRERGPDVVAGEVV